MFPDYERLVLDDYRRKKSHPKLSHSLAHPTQARLKKECLRLCRGKIHQKDERVIRDFCEEWDTSKTCFQNIDKYDVDKFKPLSNFLKEITESTDSKNIQLLAWLIDFPHRPFDYTKDYFSPMETQPGVEVPEPEGGASCANDTQDKPLHVQGVKPKWRFRKLLIIGILLAFLPFCCIDGGIEAHWQRSR